jgi:hypothetical protein
MIDVHPPHEPLHGWRDFAIHLTTITIGLLIALSLEGIVEWQEHRHLVHAAEASLHDEIRSNAKDMAGTLATLHKNQDDLKHDVDMLKILMATKKLPHGSMNISSYMPYDMAKEYASIYATQEDLTASERQAAQDTVISLGTFINAKDSDPDPTPEQAEVLMDRIEAVQGQLLLVDNYMQSLARQYKQFLAAHP